MTCAYYGLAFEAGTLPGSLYVTSSLLSLADIPGNALYTAMADHPRIGRQRTQVWLFLGGAVLLLALGLGMFGSTSWLVNGAAILGKLGMAAAFNGVYVYVVEIFPVEVRALAMPGVSHALFSLVHQGLVDMVFCQGLQLSEGMQMYK